MPSPLVPLAELGAWALPAVALPVAVWTVAALLAESVLRLRPGLHPVVPLGVRRALLWALPAGVLAAALAPGWGAASDRVAEAIPAFLSLPTLTVGGSPAPLAPEPAPVPLAALALGAMVGVAVAVALVRVVRLALAMGRLRGLSAGTAFCADVQREATRVAQREGLRRTVRARTTAAPTVPYTYGWRRPVVVVPAPLADDPPRLRLVLAHEIAHVARGDFASGVAERAIAALFGWHPLVGAWVRRIDLDRERATDAAVLARRPEARRDYGALLLSFSRLPSPALALGAAGGADALTSRLTTMQTPPLSPVALRRRRVAARVLGLGLFACAVAAASLFSTPPPQAHAAPVTPEAAPSPALPALPPEASGDGEPAAVVIRGTVSDVTTNLPIAGASVLVLGTTTGAATNASGEFVLRGVDVGEVVLRVVASGYLPVSFRPQTTDPLMIGMIPDDPSQRAAPEAERREPRRGNAPVPEVFEVVEQVPELIGGMEALAAAIVYPPEARAEGVSGMVYAQFIVDEMGAPTEIICVRSPDDRLCEAAIAAVRSVSFEPGRQRGEAVKVRFTLPVRFVLP